MKIPYENKILKSHIILSKSKDKTVIEIGKELLELGADSLVDGGFWIWKINTENEFYSPNFRHCLGFTDTNDFPNLASSWMNQIIPEDLKIALDNYKKHVESRGEVSYIQNVTYNKKDGNQIRFICSGTLIVDNSNNPLFLIGTHKIIK